MASATLAAPTILFPCSIGEIQEALTLKSQWQNLAREPIYSGFVYQLLHRSLKANKVGQHYQPEPPYLMYHIARGTRSNGPVACQRGQPSSCLRAVAPTLRLAHYLPNVRRPYLLTRCNGYSVCITETPLNTPTQARTKGISALRICLCDSRYLEEYF